MCGTSGHCSVARLRHRGSLCRAAARERCGRNFAEFLAHGSGVTQCRHFSGTVQPRHVSRGPLPDFFGRWRRYEQARQTMMTSELERILAVPKLSRNSYEVASKSLG